MTTRSQVKVLLKIYVIINRSFLGHDHLHGEVLNQYHRDFLYKFLSNYSQTDISPKITFIKRNDTIFIKTYCNQIPLYNYTELKEFNFYSLIRDFGSTIVTL